MPQFPPLNSRLPLHLIRPYKLHKPGARVAVQVDRFAFVLTPKQRDHGQALREAAVDVRDMRHETV